MNVLLPVLPLRDVSLFPEASLAVTITTPAALKAIEVATHTGNRLLALAQRDAAAGPRDLHAVGTIATLSATMDDAGAQHVELDGVQRARAVSILGTDTLVAEVEPLVEGDPGDDWGSAVEALARYLHAHADLRQFLDKQRRSAEPMAWVNLACQHLPITASARQRLLEAMAAERCVKIGRGLDALLKKEQGA
ncbi:MAG TPA: LON peptidase substrate-binding domain-containing protein [Vicinamibacteria bacterium]|nr:LON peptidase substrate-binding domain-containing protein [Vicinamibacteria bacterium]